MLVLPAIVGGVLLLIARKPLKWLVARAIDGWSGAAGQRASTTVSFSLGSVPPANLASKGTARARTHARKSAKSRREEPHASTRPMDAERRARYLEEWRRIRARFEREPARAVREAERLVAELTQKLGTSSATLQPSPPASTGSQGEGLLAAVGALAAQLRDARATKRAMALAKSSGNAAVEDLRPAIETYGRTVEQLLADPDGRRAPR
jgi:hypothetical protein